MSSVVYYKFLHQKNKSVIHFDGTAISVFDLKKEIITQNQLGSGVDFNLKLYHSEQPETEYELDNDVIPRSSYVLAKRSPANSRMGKFNNASRYITGKPRINRKVLNTTNATAAATTNAIPTTQLGENATEEERIKLMFENQSNAWAQTQDDLAQHKMIYYKPTSTTSGTNQNDVPPPGYICYRCGKKDHWIKNCPTNNDPNFEGKKIMRTTGIPKSYLKTISREEVEKNSTKFSTNDDGDIIDNEGNAILITEEGEYAIAMADSKTWTNYQTKLQNAAMKSKQEYDSRLVSLVKKYNKPEFIDVLSTNYEKVLQPPIYMTPCCQDNSSLKNLKNFNYNQTEIENTLIENDFHCPNCGKSDIYIDSLIRNENLEKELKEFIESKESEIGMQDPNKRSLEDASLDDGEPSNKKQKQDNLQQQQQQQFPQQPPQFPMGMIPPPPFGMPIPPINFPQK
ncbi:MPE1 [Candida pseudojiufengensis]|uniref:MPE1 n=1 Tax=Candida pseudojiufengensis TaxID=497109 RepID=UPI0022245586|nr:MPE1 [Candida pseudojiufengensis]KAI5959374.1 MPE1 [Candida pseudojiufengensis]